jgi:hypothetical protein
MSRPRKKPLPPLPENLDSVRALSIPDFARIFRIHEESVRRAIKSGHLEVIEITPKRRLIKLTPELRAALPVGAATSHEAAPDSGATAPAAPELRKDLPLAGLGANQGYGGGWGSVRRRDRVRRLVVVAHRRWGFQSIGRLNFLACCGVDRSAGRVAVACQILRRVLHARFLGVSGVLWRVCLFGWLPCLSPPAPMS